MKRILVILAALFFVIPAFAFPPTPPPDAGLTDASNVGISGGIIAGVTNGGIKNVLDQGTADDEIESYASDDIDHGMTDVIGTNIYGFLQKLVAAIGGLKLVGLSDADIPGFTLQGIIGTNTPSLPALAFSAQKKNGTTTADIGPDEYAFGWYNGLEVLGSVKGNGTWTLPSLEGTPIGATTPAAGTFTTFTIMSTTANTGGGYKIMYAEATSTLSGASTNIEVNIPTGAEIIGTQLRTDTEITSGDGATSFSAAFSGGMTDAICSAQPFTKNNKVNSRTSGLVDSETDITITPNSGTFSGGVVRAVVYYSIFVALNDNP